MNSLIESLNGWGARFLDFAWPMFWQSTLLIALIFVIEFALRRKARAAIRYALWLAVLIKLLLPPSLALPTSFAWWLRPSAAAPARPPAPTFVVTANVSAPTLSPLYYPAPPVRPKPAPVRTPISPAAWALIGWCSMSLGLLAWLVIRWQRVTGKMQRAARTPSPASGVTLQQLFDEAKRAAGVRRVVRLRLVEQPISPAVYGLLHPVILLPQSLVERIGPEQLRAVLLHELIHFRRADVWINCAQSLLQIVYWWHPLVWLANARIRRVREEAVDDAVMLALRGDAEHYAPALLEVAKLALNRPLATLGLVGILESRSALQHRVERLMNFTTPRRAGLSFVSLLGLAAFTALALPMGEAPPKPTVLLAQAGREHSAPRVPAATTAEQPFEIQAENASTAASSGVITFRGNVVIKFRDTIITADSTTVNQGATTVLADGHVTLRRGAATMTCAVLQYNFKTGSIQTGDLSDDASRVAPLVTIRIAEDGAYRLGTNALDLVQLRVVFLVAKEAAKESTQKFDVRIEAADTAHFEAIAQLCDLCQELGITAVSVWTLPEKSVETESASVGPGANPPTPPVASPVNTTTSPSGLNDTKQINSPMRTEETRLPVAAGTLPSKANPDGLRLDKLDLNLELGKPPSKSGLEERTGSQLYSLKGYRVSYYSNPVIYVTAEGQYRAGTNVLDLPGVRSWLASATNKSPGAALAIRADERAPYASVQALLGLYKELGLRSNLRTTPFQSGRPKFGTNAFEYVARYESPAVAETRSAESKRVDQGQASSNHNTVVVTSSARQALISKLDRIRFDRFSCDHERLVDVIHRLAIATRELDPDKQGIVFSITQNPNGTPAAPRTIDPNTGLPVAARVSSAVNELESVAIRLKGPLTNVRLADVLDAIAKSADKPIKYSIVDYGVVFSPKPNEPELHMRSFRVDPNAFFLRLQEAGAVSGSANDTPDQPGPVVVPKVHVGGTGFENWNGSGGDGFKFVSATNAMDAVQPAIIKYFLSLGVDLRPGTGKNIIYSDRSGNLLFNATKQDLEIIEAALQTLNAPQAQINLKVKFVEVGSDDNREIGPDSVLGNMIFPRLSTNSLSADTNAAFTLSGILTDPQYRAVLRELQQRSGSDVLGEAQVTTLSGRQAQIQVTDERFVALGGATMAGGSANGGGKTNTAIPLVQNRVPTTAPIPSGPTVDLIPFLAPDGNTIQLTMIPTLVEFLYYDDPGPMVIAVQSTNSNGVSGPVVAQSPIPHFRISQVTLNAIVWDGQTVVLSGLESGQLRRMKTKVPVLGDLPIVGRLFRSETNALSKKNLLIFVTPTLIDPAGNRVHPEGK